MTEKMKAVILSGGMGLRLKEVIKDIPKPMAPVGGKPFLEYLILQLKRWNIKDVILATGYKREVIMSYFRDGGRLGTRVSYSEEIEPLGTGGALREAGRLIVDEEFVVMNGDSFLSINLEDLLCFHRRCSASATMGLVEVDDAGRYGMVKVNGNGEVEGFIEKGVNGPGIINGGVYIFNQKILDRIPDGRISLEKDIIPSLIGRGLYGMVVRGFFLDIGVPEDYLKLCTTFHPLSDGSEKR